MIRSFALCAITIALGACSSKGIDPVETGPECSAGDQCGGCGSCTEACLCGGGTEARCALECTGAPPEPRDDGGAPAPKSSLSATFVTDSFEIPSGVEVVRCQNFPNPFGEDIAVTRVESYMTSGSHHMFTFITQQGNEPKTELTPCSGLAFGPNLHLAQRSHETTRYPEGVGRFFAAKEGVQLQVHYFNASEDPVKTEVAVTLYGEKPEDVPVKAGQIFINTGSIDIPPFSKGSVTRTCPVGKDLNLFTAGSHMHQNGVYYTARTSDGQLLYETDEWAEPPPWTFATPRKLKGGSFIEVTCQYENHTATPLSFGESAATNEMCIFVGSYYPFEPADALAGLACLL